MRKLLAAGIASALLCVPLGGNAYAGEAPSPDPADRSQASPDTCPMQAIQMVQQAINYTIDEPKTGPPATMQGLREAAVFFVTNCLVGPEPLAIDTKKAAAGCIQAFVTMVSQGDVAEAVVLLLWCDP